MTWLEPWAWAGLLGLAVPVLIHLLGRRNARVRRFPTLRFLHASVLMSTNRTRLSDLALLAVRLGALAAAVAALARPYFPTGDRERDLARALARAIIVDTSTSMMRPSRTGTDRERAVDVARRDAGRLAGEAQASVVLEAVAPGRAIAGASAWLATHHGKREIVIVSDFQTGALDRDDLAAVPSGIGVALTRIETAPVSMPIEMPAMRGDIGVVVRITPAPDRTEVVWRVSRPTGPLDASGLLTLAGASERRRADAASDAAVAMSTTPPVPMNRPIAVVHRGYEGRAQLMREATGLPLPWQGDVVARLRRDAILAAAALDADVETDSTLGSVASISPFTVVARTGAGQPVALAARGTIDGTDRLLLFSRADAGSLASAALISAVFRALPPAPSAAELDPTTISGEALASWRRSAAAVARPDASDPAGTSHGRWFWILALVLLGVETWMRRERRQARAVTEVHERAA